MAHEVPKISLTPLSVNAAKDAQTTVTVVVDSYDSKITAAQACIAYDKTQLEIVKTDFTKSALPSVTPSEPSSDCAAGDIQISRYGLTDHPSNTFTLGSVVFKVLATKGETKLNLDKTKSFLYDDTSTGKNILEELNGSSIVASKVAEKTQPSYALQRVMLVLLLALLGFALVSVFKKSERLKRHNKRKETEE
jgi:hypothetical protein